MMLYHGTISPNRGIQEILEAINNLKDKIPNILFLSISDNNQFLKDYCKENKLDIDEYIMYLGTQQNSLMPQFIKLADIGIIPYIRIKWWEVSSPLKLMEYTSMEKPIVLSNIKAHTDVLPEDSDFVVYFNPDNKNELSDKILFAYNNLNELKKNSWKGRQIILDNYTWEKLADKLTRYFQNFRKDSLRSVEYLIKS